MATAEELRRAREASLIFQAALVAYGIDTVADSYELWDDVQPVPRAVQSSGVRWFQRIMDATLFRHRRARSVALAYYRYHRALLTGSTIQPDPFAPTGADESRGNPTLANLRDEFYDSIEGLVPDLLNEDRELVNQDTGEVTTEAPADNDQPIQVDALPEFDDILQDLEGRAESEAEGELLNTGLLNLEALIREVDDSLPAAEVDEIRESAHAQAGARQSAAAERVALSGARDLVTEVAKVDPKVIGYVRVSSTGTPCGWCAMLISRGAVYRSSESAGRSRTKLQAERDEGDTFHPNCKCYVEPIYAPEQYDSDDRFDLNRQLLEDWKRVTKNVSGKKVLPAWRRFIRARNAQSR